MHCEAETQSNSNPESLFSPGTSSECDKWVCVTGPQSLSQVALAMTGPHAHTRLHHLSLTYTQHQLRQGPHLDSGSCANIHHSVKVFVFLNWASIFRVTEASISS